MVISLLSYQADAFKRHQLNNKNISGGYAAGGNTRSHTEHDG